MCGLEVETLEELQRNEDTVSLTLHSWCRKKSMCGKRVMVAHLGCKLGVMRGMILHLVKVLILKRDMST